MTVTARAPRRDERGRPRKGRRIDDWRPEDPEFWAAGGARLARRNLVFSIFAEHIGFSVWSLWSVLVLFLGPEYGVDPAGKFTLTAVPALIGSVLRLPYTFAVARFGGRDWTVISALLLLVPAVSAAFLVRPGVSYTTLLVLAAAAGVGGGNFASSMANINAFYPQRLKAAPSASTPAAATSASPSSSSSGSRSSPPPAGTAPASSPASTSRSSSWRPWPRRSTWTT